MTKIDTQKKFRRYLCLIKTEQKLSKINKLVCPFPIQFLKGVERKNSDAKGNKVKKISSMNYVM